MPNTDAAIALLSHAQKATGGLASSVELISHIGIDLVLKNIPDTRTPLAGKHPWYVLMEFSAGSSHPLRETVEQLLTEAIELNFAADATIADSEAKAQHLWHLRHSMSEAINHEGTGIRHDVSVPTADIPAFLLKADAAVAKAAPGARVVSFGHIGDGNIHYDIVPAAGASDEALNQLRGPIEEAVYDIIDQFNGSISAEHGIGHYKKDPMAKRKSTVELAMMRAVKQALDPDGIMNPGKML